MSCVCPVCNSLLEIVGVDKGVDATGAPADQEFTPFSTAGMPHALPLGEWRPASYAGFTGRMYYVLMPNRQSIPVKGGSLLKAYRVNDNSISDLFKKQYPHEPCTNV